MKTTRRDALALSLMGAAAGLPASARAADVAPNAADLCDAPGPVWARGVEGGRKADLGDGRRSAAAT